jgi:hypothetical protein
MISPGSIIILPLHSFLIGHRQKNPGTATFLPLHTNPHWRNDDLACLTIMMRILSSERPKPKDPGPA